MLAWMVASSHGSCDPFEPLGPVSGEHCNPNGGKASSENQKERTSADEGTCGVEFASRRSCHARRSCSHSTVDGTGDEPSNGSDTCSYSS